MRGCLFCNPPKERVLLEDSLAFALGDAYPVTPLHTLVIPHRHVPDYFSLTPDELLACDALLRNLSKTVKAEDDTVEGYNIGVNVGAVAGQTVFHCHFHLIPRRRGDVENPKGGVRHVIPGKGAY